MKIAVGIALVVGLILAVGELRAERPPTRDIAKLIYLGDPDYPLCNSRDPYSVPRSELAGDRGALSIGTIHRMYLRYLGLFKMDLSSSGEDGRRGLKVNYRRTSDWMH